MKPGPAEGTGAETDPAERGTVPESDLAAYRITAVLAFAGRPAPEY